MKLNKQKLPLIFEHGTKALFNGDDLQSAILLKADGKPVQQIKRIFKHGRYPAISISGKKTHIHKLLIEYYIGRQLKQKEVTHHANRLTYDARKENLEVWNRAIHASFHNKDKTLTADHRKKIGEANRKRKGVIKMPLRRNLPLATIISFRRDGWSINRIAHYFGVDWTTIKHRLVLVHENPELLEK